jgi:hypothetical protein
VPNQGSNPGLEVWRQFATCAAGSQLKRPGAPIIPVRRDQMDLRQAALAAAAPRGLPDTGKQARGALRIEVVLRKDRP